jgi:hypothetical protein
MKPEMLKYFHDILGSIESIESFLGDHRDFNRYLEDKMLRRAVEREIEIIGEAMNKHSFFLDVIMNIFVLCATLLPYSCPSCSSQSSWGQTSPLPRNPFRNRYGNELDQRNNQQRIFQRKHFGDIFVQHDEQYQSEGPSYIQSEFVVEDIGEFVPPLLFR